MILKDICRDPNALGKLEITNFEFLLKWYKNGLVTALLWGKFWKKFFNHFLPLVGFLLHHFPILLFTPLTPSTLHTITKFTASCSTGAGRGGKEVERGGGLGHSWVAKSLYHNLVRRTLRVFVVSYWLVCPHSSPLGRPEWNRDLTSKLLLIYWQSSN